MVQRRLFLILGLCCLLVVAPGIRAQSADDDAVRLSLGDCLRLALANNLELVSARYVPQLAEQDITVQDSAFDVNFQSKYQHTEQENAATQASTVTGSKRDQVDLAGVQQNLDFGANYTVGFAITKTVQTGPNVLAPVSYFSGFNLDFTLPLLNGFGKEVTTEQLILARGNYEISVADLERQAELTIEAVEGAYWNVVAAREALRIGRLSLTRAEDLLELNRKKVEVGTLAPIEITQAEAGVASKEEGVIVAEVQLSDAEDELRRQLAIPATDPIWDKAIYNVDRPVFEAQTVDLDASIETAMKSRPEMTSSELTLRNKELNERVAKRNVRHQLDFNAVYGPSGASLDFPGFPGVPASTADLGDSLRNIFDGDVYSWSAALTYRVPIGNRAAKANYARARLSREQSDANLRNQEQTIRVEVRTAARAVESGIKRVEAARKNVELQKEKLEAEQKKFENGMSTSFEVLTFQEDLANAELSQVQSALDYIKALAGLERAKGTLLESRGLSL